MRFAAPVLTAILSVVLSLSPGTPARAASARLADLSSTDGVLRWINAYRGKPDPAGVPAAVAALSRIGAFKDPEQAGPYTGFIAGVIHSNPVKAPDLIGKMLPLPPGDQWVMVRAIAYSDHPDWRNLLRRFEERMPSRRVMMDKYLTGALPTIWQNPPDKPSAWEAVRSFVSLDKLRGAKSAKEGVLEPTPELLDTYWGYYFATATHRPILRIVEMLPMSKNHDEVEKLTVGNMAKYSLASNAARDPDLLAMLKQAREYSSKEAVPVLDEVIEAAETVETSRLRRDALAALDELKRKGPESRRNLSFWSQVGQGAIAVGCIAAAAAGQIELGVPCVVGGAVSSAALGFWDKQP
jgi:hypothetical protein